MNLFTTQFNLERVYPQTVEFTENHGLDPVLNLRLMTQVFETTSSPMPSLMNASDMSDAESFDRFGSGESIQVQARIMGPASLIKTCN